MKTTYAPLIRKISITVFEDGEFLIQKSSMPFMGDKSEIILHAKIGEGILSEINRLVKQESFKKQKSCFRAMKDGFSSTLTLHLQEKLKVIHNENCKKTEFSLEYQYLDFLLSEISNEIENQ